MFLLRKLKLQIISTELLLNILAKSACGFWHCDRNSGGKILCKILPDLGEFYFYLCPCWELMKSVGESWELVTAICDEDDCMRICE